MVNVIADVAPSCCDHLGTATALLWVPGILVAPVPSCSSRSTSRSTRASNAIDSVRSSFKLVKDNIGAIDHDSILLSVVVMIAGVIALCVGALVALPVTGHRWRLRVQDVDSGAGRSVTQTRYAAVRPAAHPPVNRKAIYSLACGFAAFAVLWVFPFGAFVLGVPAVTAGIHGRREIKLSHDSERGDNWPLPASPPAR